MKVLILGASGIVGQHMRLCVPPGIDPTWARKNADDRHIGVDLNDDIGTACFLQREKPDVVVNLAGENRVDTVERNPWTALAVNVTCPFWLSWWCHRSARHYVHASTQAVFDGLRAPYFPDSPLEPVNEYGRQKALAEKKVQRLPRHWTIARLTFVLGIRPFQQLGRPNPLELMLDGQRPQVDNRWFSVLFARDAAEQLWQIVADRPEGIVHLGIPGFTSRYGIAQKLGCEAKAVHHEDFPDLAPRPVNTAYGSMHEYTGELDEGLARCRNEWRRLRLCA